MVKRKIIHNLVNTNKKYFLIYIISIILMVAIWNVTNEPPKDFNIQSKTSETERVEQPNIQYVTAPKGVFDYMNEMLTTVIGVINIIAFGYQMRDRRRKKI